MSQVDQIVAWYAVAEVKVVWWREGANKVTVRGMISNIDASGNRICRRITLILVGQVFLVADARLYTLPCRSVGRSVRP